MRVPECVVLLVDESEEITVESVVSANVGLEKQSTMTPAGSANSERRRRMFSLTAASAWKIFGGVGK